MILRDGTCVCNAFQNLFKDMSCLEQVIPNSVKFGTSMGYLPSKWQFFNLKVSGDNSRDHWKQGYFGCLLSAYSSPFSCRFSPHHTLLSRIYAFIKQ